VSVTLEISDRASVLIRNAGGRLWLWQEEVGNSWLTDKHGFAEPNEQQRFAVLHGDEGIQVLVPEAAHLPATIKITTHWLFRRRLRIECDGDQWGARGQYSIITLGDRSRQEDEPPGEFREHS
jgi:hypothetical protein